MSKQVKVRRGAAEGLRGGRLGGGSDGAGEAAEGASRFRGMGSGVGTTLAIRVRVLIIYSRLEYVGSCCLGRPRGQRRCKRKPVAPPLRTHIIYHMLFWARFSAFVFA